MADARHFCPECGCIELKLTGAGLVDAAGTSTGTAECPNCTWSGPLSATVGLATTEQLYDIEKVGDILLRVALKNAAGPLVQVMEYLGLIPRMVEYEGLPDAQQQVQAARDYVVSSMIEAIVTTGFDSSQKAQVRFRDWLEQHHPALADKNYGPRVRGGHKADPDKRAQQKKSRRKNRGRGSN